MATSKPHERFVLSSSFNFLEVEDKKTSIKWVLATPKKEGENGSFVYRKAYAQWEETTSKQTQTVFLFYSLGWKQHFWLQIHKNLPLFFQIANFELHYIANPNI